MALALHSNQTMNPFRKISTAFKRKGQIKFASIWISEFRVETHGYGSINRLFWIKKIPSLSLVACEQDEIDTDRVGP